MRKKVIGKSTRIEQMKSNWVHSLKVTYKHFLGKVKMDQELDKFIYLMYKCLNVIHLFSFSLSCLVSGKHTHIVHTNTFTVWLISICLPHVAKWLICRLFWLSVTVLASSHRQRRRALFTHMGQHILFAFLFGCYIWCVVKT